MISRSYSSMNKLVDFYNELVQQELRNLQSELRENKPRCLNDHRSQLTEALDLRHLDSIRPMSPHLKVQRSCSSLDIEGI
ncbi:maker38, partial [Drosophila busckii]